MKIPTMTMTRDVTVLISMDRRRGVADAAQIRLWGNEAEDTSHLTYQACGQEEDVQAQVEVVPRKKPEAPTEPESPVSGLPDLKKLFDTAATKGPKALDDSDLLAFIDGERQGKVREGDLGIHVDTARSRALDSPSYLATQIIDPYYQRHFEHIHYQALDEAIAPYLLGQTVSFNGESHDPKDYLGFLILFSRFTFKSSMAWIALLWCFLHWKIRLGVDARAMYVHQVQKKAIQRGENIRNVARTNHKFRECFPEFAAPKGEWDQRDAWSWPNYASKSAGEPSFTAYGETSEKTGGHYSPRIVDDWETEGLKTTESREQNYHSFLGMDPLIDDTQGFCPYLIPGTTYNWDGTHERLVRDGGYLVWKVPAHAGSPKAIFDLCTLDPRVPEQKRKIRSGIRKLEKERSADLNFPKRLGWEQLYMRARGQGRLIYPGQMLLNPTPEGEQRFDHDALDESWVMDPPSQTECWGYIRCDPAISKKKSADETAIVLGLVHWTGVRTLVDGWVGREKQPNEIVRKCYGLARKWQERGYCIKTIGFESVAYQEALANLARYGVPERKPVHQGESVPMLVKPCQVVSIHRSSDMSKPERLLSMDGPISRRELKFWKKCGIAERAIMQLKHYPMGKDDILDAMHDLWIKTRTPPREVEPDLPPFPKWVMDELTNNDAPALVGTHGSAKLMNWGR